MLIFSIPLFYDHRLTTPAPYMWFLTGEVGEVCRHTNSRSYTYSMMAGVEDGQNMGSMEKVSKSPTLRCIKYYDPGSRTCTLHADLPSRTLMPWLEA